MQRVLIVDDHAVVRRGIVDIMRDTGMFELVDEAANAGQLLDMVRTNPPDLVIMDLSMPGLNPLDALRELRGMMPRLPVLVLSMHAESDYAERAFRAGASGYVTKDSPPDQLVEAVSTVCQGRMFFNQSVAQLLVQPHGTTNPAKRHLSLSDREHDIFLRLAGGQRIKDIASQLALSEKTVATYRARILEKMGMRTNAEMTSYALRFNLMLPPL